MAFTLNEKMMATDRAIITRNRTGQDLLKTDVVKFKPGMIHYVSENAKLWLSIDPERLPNGNIKTFKEIMTDTAVGNVLTDYVHRDGGATHSLRGPLHSDVATGQAPFIISSETLVTNLNVDRLDDMHMSINATPNTIVGRDNNGNINIRSSLSFDTNILEDAVNGVAIKNKVTSDLADISAATINSSSGIIKANNLPNIGVIEWNNNAWFAGEEGNTSEIVTTSHYGHGNGIDADTIDNRHVDDTQVTDGFLWTAKKIDEAKAPRGHGLGTDVDAIPNNDCNAVNSTGFFSGLTPLNGPVGEAGDALLQSYIDANNQYQEIEYIASGNTYSRFREGGNWSIWDVKITKNNILEEGINIILSANQPMNITNENTYWYEII